MANFSSNFVAALPGGIDLANEWREQRKHNSARKAGDLLAQLQSYDPETTVDNPMSQGLPEEGQVTVMNPSQGFSGMDYKKLTDQYFAEAAKGGDLQAYAAATQLYGEMRKGKVMDSVNAGLAAYGQGDINGATRAMRRASAYLNPGVTPEINYSPETDSFVVANYKDGKPSGGYALKPDDLKEMLTDIGGRTNDFGDWARLEESKAEFREQMNLRYAQFNASNARANAAAAKNAASDALKLKKLGYETDTAGYEAQLKGLEAQKAAATQPTAIEAGIATNRGTTATQEAIATTAPVQAELDVAQDKTAIAAEGRKEDERLTAERDAQIEKNVNGFMQMNEYLIEPTVPVPAGGSGPVAPVIPDPNNQAPTDLMGTSGDGKGKKVAYDPAIYDTSPTGMSTLKPEVNSMIGKITDDFINLNGDQDIPDQAQISLISGVVGRSQHAQLMTEAGDPNVPGSSRSFITDGVYKAEIGPDTYKSVWNWIEDNKREFAMSRGDPVPLSERPPEPSTPPVDTLTPEVGTGQTQIPDAPGAWSPQGAIPGQVAPPVGPPPSGPGIRDYMMGSGIPTEQQPGLQGPSPRPDDTAAIVGGSGNTRAGVVGQQPVTDLASAVAAWEDVGRPNNGTEYEQVVQYLNQLPEEQRRQAARAIYDSAQGQ